MKHCIYFRQVVCACHRDSQLQVLSLSAFLNSPATTLDDMTSSAGRRAGEVDRTRTLPETVRRRTVRPFTVVLRTCSSTPRGERPVLMVVGKRLALMGQGQVLARTGEAPRGKKGTRRWPGRVHREPAGRRCHLSRV